MAYGFLLSRSFLLLELACFRAVGYERALNVVVDDRYPSHKTHAKAIKQLQKGRAEKALEILRKTLRKNPADAPMQNSLGVTLMHLALENKDLSLRAVLFDAAAQAFSRARELATSGDAEILENVVVAEKRLKSARLNIQGIRLDDANRWEEAAVSFAAALDASPEFDPHAANNLGAVIYKNATYSSLGWLDAEPLYENAFELVTSALQLMPSNPAIRKSHAEVSGLLSKLKIWRDKDTREVPVPASLLKERAINNTVICTWVGGGAEYVTMALNLVRSLELHAPRWAKAFVVLALDKESKAALLENNLTTWLFETVDIFMTRWKLLAGVLKAGFDVLLMDTDIVFLGDPFQFFYFDADFEVMTDHLFPSRDLWDQRWRDEEHINTGFLFVRSTSAAINFTDNFILSHHSPWTGSGGGKRREQDGALGFDLFDQRLFSRFARTEIEDGRCFSMFEDREYGSKYRTDESKQAGTSSSKRQGKRRKSSSKSSVKNPSIRILSPDIIAHGASFFWTRSYRLSGLKSPPVAHANFGRHKLYFLRDRNVWFVEDYAKRFRAPPLTCEYIPPVKLPGEFLDRGEPNPFMTDDQGKVPRFLRYTHVASDSADGVARDFLVLAAALEVAVTLGLRLILPAAFDCRQLPAFKPYQMDVSFSDVERKRCTLDYFADTERFHKRFDRFVVEAGFVDSNFFKALPSSPAKLTERLMLLPDANSTTAADLSTIRAFRHRLVNAAEQDGWKAVVEIGAGEQESDIIALRDLLRRKLGNNKVFQALWRCRWIDFEGWYFARRPGQPMPAGQRACGVDGLDCCSVYNGWSEKLEYFTGVPWNLPCDCGVGAALGCVVRDSGECLREDETGITSGGAFDLAEELRRDFTEL